MIDSEAFAEIFHADANIRLSAFQKLCRQEKTTSPISERDFSLIRRFVYFNVNVSDQGFRQKFLTCVKYLLIRLKESGYAISRETEANGEDSSNILVSYKDFIQWLVEFCFYCIRLRGNYSRRASVLSILELIYCSPVLADDLRGSYVSSWALSACWTDSNVGTFASCLADSYESNQSLALRIAKGLPDQYFESLDWSSLVSTAFEWCTASKTQYPEMAIYFFLFAIHKTDLATVLDADAVLLDVTDATSLRDKNRLILLRRFLDLLRHCTEVAEKDLVQAAIDGPPWGLLRSVLYVLKEIDWSTAQQQRSNLAAVIELLLDYCHRLAKVVEPVVNSTAPEGYVPANIGAAFDSKIHRDEETSVAFERWRHTVCQAVQVCSWRTHKEISALFGFLASVRQPRPILDLHQLELIGKYFLIQLTECKHRGAFECAYAAFVDMCESLWISPNEAMRTLPECWLRKIIDGLDSDNSEINYCTTRRSAGVPFLVQAVLATEPRSKDGEGTKLLYETLERLLRILFQDDDGGDGATAKVHALNILRALVKESKLGLSSLTPPWLSLLAQADLALFTHRSWAVRNSSSLLFSSLMVRLFGVPRSRESISPKNRMSSGEFEVLCPGLLDFMVEELRVYSCQPTAAMASFREMILFPILSILCRLHPSDPSTDLSRSIPHVLDILISCPIITVRRSAASALFSISGKSSIRQLIRTFGNLIAKGECPQNTISGMLILVQCAADSSELFEVDFGGAFATLCPLNLASLLKALANQPKFSSAAVLGKLETSLEPNGKTIAGNSVFGPIASLALSLALEKDSALLEEVCNRSKDNAALRYAVYKQWKTISKSKELRKDQLTALAEQFCNGDFVWRDITAPNVDFKLRMQACKFYLRFHPAFDTMDRNGDPAMELFLLYKSFTPALLRRLLLRLACQCCGPQSKIELSDALLKELDAASMPHRPLDDRLMVIDSFASVDPQFLKGKRTMIPFIRLLTDLNDFVQDKASFLFLAKFGSNLPDVQSSVVLFICVARLLLTGSLDDGKRVLSEYLLEIVDELSLTLESNVSDERIFDKNESNYNLEPLLIAEWSRTVPHLDSSNVDSVADITAWVAPCLAVDGLKSNEKSFYLKTEERDQIQIDLLRRLAEEVLD